MRWTGQRLTIDGWAGIGGLDLTGIVPELDAWLIRIETGERVDCLVQQVDRPEANQWARFSQADLATGGFTITVDTATIDDRPGRWQLWLVVRAQDVERSGPVQVVVPGESAGDFRPGNSAAWTTRCGWWPGWMPNSASASRCVQS